MCARYQHVVVGAGVEGSWTAYNLARRGRHVLLLEQFPLPHTRGSSHGQSRIIRKAYPEECHALLMDEAYQEWRQLEKDTGVNLLVETGLLCLAGPSGYGAFNDVMNSFSKLRVAKYKELDLKELREKFPQVKFGEDYRACVDYEGGILRADVCLATVRKRFLEVGGVIRDSTEVHDIEPGHPVTVRTGKESFQGDSVVLCPGPWAKELTTKLGLDLPLTPLRTNVFYWRVKEGGFIPTTFMDLGSVGGLWGIPELEYPKLVKICAGDHTRPANPNKRDENSCESVEVEEKLISEYIKRHFPGIEPKPSVLETCMVTMTPDDLSIMDRHPQHDNIIIGCGFSGTGFKIGPAVGQILGDLSCGQQPSHDVKPFTIQRFLTKA